MTTGSMAELDPQPTLRGGTLLLRPLRAADFAALYAAAADPLVWAQHPEPLRYRREVFASNFFAGAIASGSALAVVDVATGAIIGSSRYYDLDHGRREVAIGYTFLARSHWGGASNRELKTLMLDHAFRWAEVVWFHVGSNNLRSRRAVEKIGARLDHEGRKEAGGIVHDYTFYRIDAAQWRRANGER